MNTAVAPEPARPPEAPSPDLKPDAKPERRGLIGWIRSWFQSFNPYVPEELAKDSPDGIEPVQIEESSIKKKAGTMVFLFFGVFLVWAFTAPIDAGVPVEGTVVVEGSRKAVQHPTGGVIEAINVGEGDLVKAGDILIRINPLKSEAELRDAEYQYINALATYSRLLTERRSLQVIDWVPALQAFGNNTQVSEAKLLERQLFESRREDYETQLSILQEQLDGLRNQLKEKREVEKLQRGQLGSIREEAENLESLAADGFVPRSQAFGAMRSLADAEAGLINMRAEIAQLETSITSNRLEQAKLRSAYNTEVDTLLTETQKLTETLKAKVDALRFDRGLTEIRAPVSGVVVGLEVHTVGGVISGGDVLMELVPEQHGLIVRAQVPPDMIDKVKVGLEASIRFAAMHLRTTPVIPGEVTLVGADLLPPQPPTIPSEYYLALVQTTELGAERIGDFQIQAGMPATVLIRTGERSFMNYVTKPIADLFVLAFKEQ